MNNKLLIATAAAVAISVSAPAIAADAGYFKNKTMKIVIPYGPGGTYDKYGQAFAGFTTAMAARSRGTSADICQGIPTSLR